MYVYVATASFTPDYSLRLPKQGPQTWLFLFKKRPLYINASQTSEKKLSINTLGGQAHLGHSDNIHELSLTF